MRFSYQLYVSTFDQIKTVGFFLKSLSPVSLSVFSLVPDLLFDCSRVLEYAKIRTVLQSTTEVFLKSQLRNHNKSKTEGYGRK